MAASCNSQNRQSALDPLPTELIHTVLALARPSSITAAACRRPLYDAANSTLVSRAWRNRVLLGDGAPLTLPRVFHAEEGLQRDNLTVVLRSLLPKSKTVRRWFHQPNHLFPLNHSTEDVAPTLLSTRYVKEYLFTPNGPLFRQRNGLELDLAPELDAQWDMCQHFVSHRAENWIVPWRWWNSTLDPVTLVIFFLRTGQLHLLQFTLEQLLSVFPPLAIDPIASSAPMSRWAMLCIDAQSSLLNRLQAFATNEPEDEDDLPRDPVVPLSLFLAFVAIYNWCIPALDIILTAFSFPPAEFAAWVEAPGHMINGPADGDFLFHMLQVHLAYEPADELPPDYEDRVVAVLSWINQHCHPDWLPFPLANSFSGTVTMFLRVAREVDLPQVDNMPDVPLARQLLSSCVLTIVTNVEVDEQDRGIVAALKDHGLLSPNDWAFFLCRYFTNTFSKKNSALDWSYIESQVDPVDVAVILAFTIDHLLATSPSSLFLFLVSLPTLAFTNALDPIADLTRFVVHDAVLPSHLLSALTISDTQLPTYSWLTPAHLTRLADHLITTAAATDPDRITNSCLLASLLVAQALSPTSAAAADAAATTMTARATRGSKRSWLAEFSREQLAVLLAGHFVALLEVVDDRPLLNRPFYAATVTSALVAAYQHQTPPKSKLPAGRGQGEHKAPDVVTSFSAVIPPAYRAALAEAVAWADAQPGGSKAKGIVLRVVELDAEFVRESCALADEE